MIFRDRADVESIGRSGAWAVTDEYGQRGRQLSSFWLYVDPEDNGYTPHALSDGFWEAWITLWMDKNVLPGSNVLDIGANHGYYSFFLANRGCNVIAIEPQPRLANLLRLSNQVNTNPITVVQEAVADHRGTIDMMVPIHHGMNATISNQHSYAPDGFDTITVSTMTLDDVYNIDFVKVDAEGAEDLIWAGSKKFRKNNPNCLWLMEWRWDRYKEPEKFAEELINNCRVSAVGFDGRESPILMVSQLAAVKNSDWMLVLRKKA